MHYIHKHEVSQQYGGPEEGGWWFTSGFPVEDWTPIEIEDEEQAFEVCRALNAYEKDRAKREEEYEFTSVLSHRSSHYSYDVSGDYTAKPFPERRPHYE